MPSILISGAGSIGQRHMLNLLSLDEQQLAICDPSEDRLQEVRGKHDLQAFQDFTEALIAVMPDIVFICSPSFLHIPQAIEAANAGAHLFIEKPLSHSLDGIDELEKIVEKKNLITMVGCNMRFHPGPKKVKELIKENAIGDIIAARIKTGSYLPRWRPHQDYKKSYSADPEQGGVIRDCIHEIDLALWYLGPATLRDSAIVSAKSIGLEVDGLAELSFQHDSGALSSVHLNFIQQNYKRCCEIIGTKGTIEWDFNEKRVDFYGSDGTQKEKYMEPEEWEMNEMYRDEIASFLQSVQTEAVSACPLEEGRAALTLALSALER